MTAMTFKLKRGDALPRFAYYSVRPTWAVLSLRIAEDFGIPQKKLGLAFVDHDESIATLTNQTELQDFYDSDKSSGYAKFFVQNQDAPEAETAIRVSWSAESNLSKSDEKFKLFCWILNMSYDPFSVRIGKSETIDDLKEAIKKRMENAFSGVDSYLLNLWKLSSPTEIDKLRLAKMPEDIEDCIKLPSYNELQVHFSSPPVNNIHIVIQLPPTGIAKLPAPAVDTGLNEDKQIRRLRLFCEKYWNRGEKGRREIYRTEAVEVFMKTNVGAEGMEGVTTTLEDMVTDSEQSAQEVITTASKTRSAPASDTSEESEEVSNLDNSDSNNMKTIFYESLSLGHDFCDFFQNDYHSILVREEYRDMLRHISNLCEKGNRGVVVTGMPGIGKTFFLYFVLIERILDGRSTAFQWDPSRVVLLLNRHDVRTFPSAINFDPEGYPGTWALVDSNSSLVTPRSEFIDARSKFFVVQAASPRPERWKTWKKELTAEMAVMKPWSWEEIYIGGTKFISPPLEGFTLHRVFNKYGGSARHCYSLAKVPVRAARWEATIPQLLNATPNMLTYRPYIAESSIISETVESVSKSSSQLITIIPDSERQPCVTLVSQHITEHLFNAVLNRNHELFWKYYKQFSSVPESHTPAGWLWELYAISRLQNHPIGLRDLPPPPSEPSTKKIRLDVQVGPVGPFSVFKGHGDKKSLTRELSLAIRSGKPILFKPGAKNQATYVAFSISDDNVVTLYQPTIGGSLSSSVKAKGLDYIWDALKDASGGKILLPKKGKRWRLVFLVDEDVDKHWKTARGIDYGGTKPKHQWGDYIQQFVGVLPKSINVGSTSTPISSG